MIFESIRVIEFIVVLIFSTKVLIDFSNCNEIQLEYKKGQAK